MDKLILNKIADGTPGVMLVVDAADLKSVVSYMWGAHVAQTKETIAANRERPTMTREDAAKALNVTLSTLWRWAKMGYLNPVKIGTKVLYRATDIDSMLKRKGGVV